MDRSDLKNKALAHLENNQLEEARALYTEASLRCPSDVDAWHMLSAINGMLGQYEESESCARKVIKLNPKIAPAYNNLGAALLAQSRLKEARKAFEKAIKLNRRDPETHNNIGNIWAQEKNFYKASQYYRTAISLKPDSSEAYSNLGGALLGLDDLENALTNVEIALRINPKFPGALVNYAKILHALNRQEQALEFYRRALQLAPHDTNALFGISEILNQMEAHLEAIQHYAVILKIEPNNANAMIGIGTTYQKLRDHTSAISILKQAKDADPKRADTLHYLGVSYKEMDDIEHAIAFFQKALEVDPKFVQASHMLASLGQGPIPDKADSQYVSTLFDEYADHFDDHLIKLLEYKVPITLGELLSPLLGKPEEQLDILDLGCGTGLCAPIFKPWGRHLTGVDLSEKMIERAKALDLYSELIVGDMLELLSSNMFKFDLILAADVFIYLGKLDEIIAASAKALRSGGLLAFSVESLKNSNKSYILHRTGRYAHNLEYIRTLSENAGLVIDEIKESVLRKEKGSAVEGAIFVIKKPN